MNDTVSRDAIATVVLKGNVMLNANGIADKTNQRNFRESEYPGFPEGPGLNYPRSRL